MEELLEHARKTAADFGIPASDISDWPFDTCNDEFSDLATVGQRVLVVPLYRPNSPNDDITPFLATLVAWDQWTRVVDDNGKTHEPD